MRTTYDASDHFFRDNGRALRSSDFGSAYSPPLFQRAYARPDAVLLARASLQIQSLLRIVVAQVGLTGLPEVQNEKNTREKNDGNRKGGLNGNIMR